MPKITFLKPTDQPTGALRLLNELKTNLAGSDFNDMKMVVAFAKHGPLLRLRKEIVDWKTAGKPIQAVFGVDQNGTSRQALEFALEYFRATYIAHVGHGPFSPTFHPKMYVFSNDGRVVAYVGSNNLTVGGTETNLECCIKLDLKLPDDEAVVGQLMACWDDTVRMSRPLNTDLLAQLTGSGMVLDENQMRRSSGPRGGIAGGGTGTGGPDFPSVAVLPASPIPPDSLRSKTGAKQKTVKGQTKAVPATPAVTPIMANVGTQALVIQIRPHHNGEVFLSKIAVGQNPAFFGWPFTGRTIPKKQENPSYPQRSPDPVIDLKVYNKSGTLVVRHNPLNLNTVYYEKKSEIRITVPPDVVKAAPDGSIMVMRLGQVPGVLDYDVDIYVPGSSEYKQYLSVCNQKMPPGGGGKARQFGWL